MTAINFFFNDLHYLRIAMSTPRDTELKLFVTDPYNNSAFLSGPSDVIPFTLMGLLG